MIVHIVPLILQAKLENINQYTTISPVLIKLRDFHERLLSKLIK